MKYGSPKKDAPVIFYNLISHLSSQKTGPFLIAFYAIKLISRKDIKLSNKKAILLKAALR